MYDQNWSRIFQQNASAIRQAQLAVEGISPAVMREFETARALQELTEGLMPSSVRLLKQFQDAQKQIRRFAEPTVFDALSEYVRHANIAQKTSAYSMGQYVRESRSALDAISTAMRGFSVLADMSAISQGRVPELAKLPAMRSISDFVSENGYETALASTAAMGKVIARLYELEAGTATVEDVALEVEAVLDEPQSVVWRGPVVTEGRIGLFVSILALVITIVSCSQTDAQFDRLEEDRARQHNTEIERIDKGFRHQAEEISEYFRVIEERLIDSVGSEESSEDSRTLYIVMRDVNLRDLPTTKGRILGVLYPNQIVELVERDKKWIRVKYYNHLETVEEVGWVNKKYFKILNRRGVR